MENPYQLPQTEWASRVLFRNEIGSTAHGIGIADLEDYDEIAVMTQPLDTLVGLRDYPETIVYRPGRADHERSGPGDWDLTVHTARKWCRLAADGNPSIIVSAFGPRVQATEKGLELLESYSKWFWSELARWRFLGYAKAQRERLLGIRGGKHTNRPELVERFGYDTKYASHMVRLGFQGIEYMQTGKLQLPMEDERGDILRGIRTGKYEKQNTVEIALNLEEQLKDLETDAPALPDYNAINKWLVSLHK